MAALLGRMHWAVGAGLLLAGVALIGNAPAAQKKVPKTPKNTTITHVQIVDELVATRHLLHLANHDYKGHRAAAAHEVHKALKALDPQHKHHKKHDANAVVKNEGRSEDQALSDAQLRKAIDHLKSVRTQLTGVTGAHHIAAYEHVGIAIVELQTALKIN